jgi:hypothetical protein
MVVVEEVIIMHYVCPKCGGMADHPKVCETEGCGRQGHELKECHCTDNKHEEVRKAEGDEQE